MNITQQQASNLVSQSTKSANSFAAPQPASPAAASYDRDKDPDLPAASQSWPAAANLGFEDGEIAPADVPWSPAAAFLAAFSCPDLPDAPPAGVSIPGYVLGPTIGNGAFSTIREATSPSGGVVAVKIVRNTAFAALPAPERAKQHARLAREARIWGALSHENILPLFDAYRTSEATFLITLLCPAGSLLDILRRDGRPALEQTDVGYMFRQTVKALQYLHESVRLVHGDVKLENVLVDECGVCRLADFGLARHIRGADAAGGSGSSEEDAEAAKEAKEARAGGKAGLSVHLSLLRHGGRHSEPAGAPAMASAPVLLPGSLPYAAPELLLPPTPAAGGGGAYRRPAAHPAQDMWALGVMLYTLLTGVLPFRDAFEPRLQMKIHRGKYEMPQGIGPHAEAILRGCLQREAAERWTIAQVDNAAWGVGYGDVELDPALREEQRTQSQEHLAPSAVAAPPPPGSRSPSPSIAPKTPNDEGGPGEYFGPAAPSEEGGVQIVGENEWDAGGEEQEMKRHEDPTHNTNGRGRTEAKPKNERQKSRSRTRTWPL